MKKKEKVLSPPEHSVGVRVLCYVMSVLSIFVACFYTHAPILQLNICIFILTCGNYLAYKYRFKKNSWMTCATICGATFMMFNFGKDLLSQIFNGQIDLLTPSIFVLAGLQALHSFDLRARSDINASALLGMALLALSGIMGQDIVYGTVVCTYIMLASALLCLECTVDSGGKIFQNIGNVPETIARKPKVKTLSARTFANFAILPILTTVTFLYIPHIESLIDHLAASLPVGGLPFFLSMPLPPDLFKGVEISTPPSNSHTDSSSLSGSPTKNTSPSQRLSEQLSQRGAQALLNRLPESKINQKPNLLTPTKNHVSPSLNVNEEEMSLLYDGKKEAFASASKQLLLTMSTTRPLFLKRLCFDHFDGKNWTVSDKTVEFRSDANTDLMTSLSGAPVLGHLNTASLPIKQDVQVINNLGHIVPAAWMPQSIAVSSEKIMVDTSGALHVSDSLRPGSHYAVISQVPIYNLNLLRSVDAGDLERQTAQHIFRRYLQLPSDLNPHVVEMTKAIAGQEKNWFNQAEKICHYLRDNYEYSLAVKNPDSNQDLVNYFLLQSKAGDCSHFASSFVVMCRSIGIPARCVGGFTPGQHNIFTGLYEVSACHSHAWGEICVPRFGWIAFDAVPTGYLPEGPPDHSLLNRVGGNAVAKQLSNFVDSLGNTQLPTLNQFGNNSQRFNTRMLPSGSPLKDGAQNNKSGLPFILSNISKRHSQFLQQPDHTRNLFSFEAICNALKLDQFLPHDAALLVVSLGVLALLVIGIFLVYKYLLAGKFVDQEKSQPHLPATVIFLQVVKDLSKLKIRRSPADTASDLIEKSLNELKNINNPQLQANLPILLEEFMDVYSLNRFSSTDSLGKQESAELNQELKTKAMSIHQLVKTM